MEHSPPDLRSIQEWMQAVTTHPGGVRAGLHSEAARLGLSQTENSAGFIVKPSRTLSSEERLAIYGRAYNARLLECFHAEYPCLRFALGDELLRDFVADYLHRYPPASYTLFALGRNFTRYLAESRPDAEKPLEQREGWPDFITDLATLERVFMDAFDGSGIENQPIVSVDDIQSLTDDALTDTHFRTAVCLRLMEFSYPVNEYFENYRAGLQPGLPAARTVYLAVTRREFVVRFHQLSKTERQILAGLSDGLSVREAIAGLEAADQRIATTSLRRWISRWAGWQFFQSIAS